VEENFMSRKRRKYRNKISSKNKLLWLLVIILLAGFFAGVLLSGSSLGQDIDGLTDYVEQLRQSDRLYYTQQVELLKESLFKHLFTIALIWFLGFIRAGVIGSLGILAVRGAAIGFTSAALIKICGLTGLYYITALTLPQSLVIIPVYLLAAYSSTRFMLEHEGASNTRPSKTPMSLTEYFLILVLCLAAAGLVSFYEAYGVPWVIENLIN